MAVSHRPEGFHSVTPAIVVDGCAKALDFYVQALGAEELYRLPMGDMIAHAEMKIGDSIVMLSDEWPDMNMLGPAKRGGPSSGLYLYVPDVDASHARAVAAGAKADKPPEDQFWGDRVGSVIDPWGHRWTFATRVREMSPEEIAAEMAKFSQGG